MAETFTTTPHNFDKDPTKISPTKYLDLAGLIVFFEKLKEYIEASDKNLNGSNIKMYAGDWGVDNPTISSQIENLWAAFGEGDLGEGGLAGNISAILGQYVKDIKHAETQELPLKVQVVEGATDTDQKDIYTISLVDDGLSDALEDVETNRVSNIDTVNGGGSVTISVNKNKGDVILTVNSSTLTEDVESLKTGKIASVTEGSSSETYVELGVSTSNQAVTITISDAKLVEELNDIKGAYALKTEIPTHLPSLYSIKLKGTDGKEHTFNGSAEVDLTAGVNYAANSGKLGGQEPGYYAKQSDLNSTNERIGDVEDSYVKTFGTKKGDITISSGSTTPWDVNFVMDNNTLKGTVVEPSHLGIENINASSSLDGVVTITESESNGTSTITIGGTLKEDLGDINDALKDRVQKVDVENGNTGTKYVTISVTDDTNSATGGKQSKITINDSALTEAIGDIKGTIAALGTVVELKGVKTEVPATTEGYGNGDFIIVGDEEYICFESKWYLVGTVGSLGEIFNAHIHTYTPAGTIESDFAGTQATITTGGASGTADVSKLKTAGSVPTYSSVSASSPNHTHSGSYTPAGIIESGFDGTTATITTGGASAVTDVSKLKTAGSVPTYSGVSVPNTLHTHSVTHTPAGTVTSTFAGKTDTITTGGASATTTVATAPTISYSDAVLTITFGTTTVASSAHTHSASYTPAGTVTSTFEGTQSTINVSKSNDTVDVNSMTSAGSMPTFDSVEVASSTHTHSASYKPAGTVTSTFVGTQGNTSVPTDLYEVPDEIVE